MNQSKPTNKRKTVGVVSMVFGVLILVIGCIAVLLGSGGLDGTDDFIVVLFTMAACFLSFLFVGGGLLIFGSLRVFRKPPAPPPLRNLQAWMN